MRCMWVLLTCAWVLWSQTVFMNGTTPTSYEPDLSEETKADCEQQKDARMARWRQAYEQVGEAIFIAAKGQPPQAVLSYRCLPDTVDLRKPK